MKDEGMRVRMRYEPEMRDMKQELRREVKSWIKKCEVYYGSRRKCEERN